MERRTFLGRAITLAGGFALLGQNLVWAETFLTPEQAREILWGPDIKFDPVEVTLTQEQMRAISQASKVKVRYSELHAWKTAEGGWFIVDQVIGKHENIDLAVAINPDGKIRGLEVLTYRETYGAEIRHPKWREQFHGRNNNEKLKLGSQIRNISGATLSCKHVTEGINRLTETWAQVLRHL